MKMKPKIICIVGESGSGKSHLAKYLTKTYKMNYLQSHTDRPKRSEDEVGHTFHTSESFDKIREEDMIAFNRFGDYRYCATKDQIEDENVYVIDEIGISMLEENWSNDYDIIGIRIVRPNPEISEERKQRDENQFILPIEFYDFHIINNKSLEDLESTADKIMDEVL